MQANSKVVVANSPRYHTWKYTIERNGHRLISSTSYTRRDNCLRGVRRLLNSLGSHDVPVSVTNNTTGRTSNYVL